MPIKGMTDQGRRFPRIGQLRKGGEKVGNKPGKDLDQSFRFVSDDKQAQADFLNYYGDEPTSINCYLPYHTVEENFPTWKEEWLAGGLVHRCDGETCVMWLDKKTNTYAQTPIPCPGGCNPVGKLVIIISELQRFAYVEVPTTSVWDIVGLTENLEAYQALGDSLQDIPFVLSRKPREISTPSGKDGGRARRVKWLLHIEPHPEWAKMQLSIIHRRALVSPTTGTLALPGGRIVDQDTGEVYRSLDDGEIDDDDDVDTVVVSDRLVEAEQAAINWAMSLGMTAEDALTLWEQCAEGMPQPATDEVIGICKLSFKRKVEKQVAVTA